MCLLTYFPPEIQPDLAALFYGSLSNDDGHGFAIVSGKRLIVRRGLNAEQMIDLFEKMRRQHPSGPALFHSRFGTGGIYSTYNVHPFHLGGDRLTVVAHNGILPALAQPGRKDKRCDTRYAAEELLPTGFGHLGGEDTRAALATWVGRYNKLAFLTVNPAYDHNAYLINEQHGLWADGIWYSNLDYLPPDPGTAPRSHGDECPFCGERDALDRSLGICLYCDTCLDCCQPWRLDCQCYLPDTVRGIETPTTPPHEDWADIIQRYSYVTD